MSEESEDIGAAYRARLGDLMVAWSFLEFNLDTCASSIFRHHNGAVAVGSQFPTSLEKRIAFVQKALAAGIPYPRPMGAMWERVLSQIAEAKDLRHTIVHAVPLKIERNGTVHYVRVRYSPTGPETSLRVVRLAEWEAFDDSVTRWAASLTALAITLEAKNLPPPPSPDEGDEAARKFIMQFAAAFPGSKRLRNLVNEGLLGRLNR